MFISRKEYDRITTDLEFSQSDCAMWKKRYEALEKDREAVVGDIVYVSLRHFNELLSPVIELEEKVERLQSELNDYKQKYADEVQKRLALIEQMKG